MHYPSEKDAVLKNIEENVQVLPTSILPASLEDESFRYGSRGHAERGRIYRRIRQRRQSRPSPHTVQAMTEARHLRDQAYIEDVEAAACAEEDPYAARTYERVMDLAHALAEKAIYGI